MTQIPAGWEETTLGKACIVMSWSTPSTKEELYRDWDISWITPKDLSNYNERYIAEGERNITESWVKNSSAQILPPNTILFSSRAPIWYVAIAKKELTTNQGFKNIICDEKESHYLFFYYWLKYRSEYIEKISSGSTFTEASAAIMRSLPIHLPHLPEQQAIAAVLSSFDDKIELLRAENQTLEQMGQELFKERFGKWKVRDELPEGWRVGKLGEEFDISIGRTPPRAESEWFSNKPIGKKWISIKDMVNSWIYISNTSEFLTDEAIAKFNIPIIPNNTTILSFKMTVGKLAITTEDMLSNEAIAHFKLKSNSVLSSEFIYCYLSNLDFNSLWSTSSVVTAINSTIIKELSCIIPDQETLSKFDLVIKPLFNKIRANSEQIQTLSSTRDLLLPKLMSGEVRVEF